MLSHEGSWSAGRAGFTLLSDIAFTLIIQDLPSTLQRLQIPILTLLWICLFFFLVVYTFFFFFFLPPSKSAVKQIFEFELRPSKEVRWVPWQTALQSAQLTDSRRPSRVVSGWMLMREEVPSRKCKNTCIDLWQNINNILDLILIQEAAKNNVYIMFCLSFYPLTVQSHPINYLSIILYQIFTSQTILAQHASTMPNDNTIFTSQINLIVQLQVIQRFIFNTYIIFENKIMNKLALTLVITLLLASAHAEEDKYRGPSEEDVIVLDADTLEPTIYQSEDTWLLELYAPWCGHCKTLRPEWAKLATKMKGIAKVAKIDASIHRKFDQVFGLKGYPHVVLIPGGPKDKKIYYSHEGARTTDSLYDWALQKMKQNKGFLVERLTNEQKWNENCVDLDIPLCVVTFLPNMLDSSQEQRRVYLEIIRGTVNNFRDKPVSFLWAQAGDHPELQDQFSLYSGFPAVLLINPQRRIFSIMKSSFTEQNFEEWLKDILNRKGGRRFGQYSKSLSFGNVAEEPVAAEQEDVSIDVAEGDEFAAEL